MLVIPSAPFAPVTDALSMTPAAFLLAADTAGFPKNGAATKGSKWRAPRRHCQWPEGAEELYLRTRSCLTSYPQNCAAKRTQGKEKRKRSLWSPVFRLWFLVGFAPPKPYAPSTTHQAPRTTHCAPRTKHHALRTKNQALRTKHFAPSTKHYAPRTSAKRIPACQL